jgi:hypothetical protein
VGGIGTTDHHDRGWRRCIYALFWGGSVVFGKLQQGLTISNYIKNFKRIT